MCNELFFVLVTLVQTATIIWAWYRWRHYKPTHVLNTRAILIGGTFLTAAVLFFGLEVLANTGRAFMMKLTMAIHNSIRLFVVDFDLVEYVFGSGGYQSANQSAKSLEDLIGADNSWFTVFIGMLFIFAPCLTFELVLSFFGDTVARCRVHLGISRDKYVFSELNDKSMALAESIYAEGRADKSARRRMIIFANVNGDDGKASGALFERAKRIRAVCFKREIAAINYAGARNELTFFAVGQDDSDNVKVATQIRERYGDRRQTTLYIFSSSVEAELFACAKEKEEIEIRRVNEARALVYRTLYDMEVNRIKSDEPDLFTSAVEEGEVKKISAVIVGLGHYGEEMLKALTWFCQMDGYRIKINAFDSDPLAENRIRAKYPELLDKQNAEGLRSGDARYEMNIHSDVNVETVEFAERIGGLEDATYIFVALGSDEANIAAAVLLRRLFKQKGKHPMIHAVVYNSDKAQILDDCKNFRGDEYDIQSVGDLEKLYSEDVMINSELEAEALMIHRKYGKPDNFDSRPDPEQLHILEQLKRDFFSYEYFYRSSMASALHLKARIACGLQGKGVTEDVKRLSILEHCRWNAYMRTEGYRFSGSMEKSSRSDMGKLHHLMVPFEELPEEEKAKDRRISL